MTRVRVTVEIMLSGDGSFSAMHAPATDADAAVLSSMRLGGQDVVAAALLGEAVRRQAAMMVGLLAASDPVRTGLLRSRDPKEVADVAAAVLDVVTRVAGQVSTRAVAGAVDDVAGTTSDQIG